MYRNNCVLPISAIDKKTHKETKKCVACSGTIWWKYYVDWWGNRVCAKHVDKNEIANCKYCGKFIPANMNNPMRRMHYAQDIVCNECLRQAISSTTDLHEIYLDVLRRVNTYGFIVSASNIDIRLATAAELKKMAAGDGHNGLVQHISTLGRHSIKSTIYILQDMPSIYVYSTIAHELFHVFTVQHGLILPAADDEGGANLWSYFVLTQIGNRYAQYLIECLERSEHPLYGAGYRKAKEIVFSQGMTGYMRYLESRRKRFL